MSIPDTGAVVLVAQKHSSAPIVVVGCDGACVPGVVLETPLGGLQFAVALNLKLFIQLLLSKLFRNSTCVTLIVKALVVAVEADPKLADNSLH